MPKEEIIKEFRKWLGSFIRHSDLCIEEHKHFPKLACSCSFKNIQDSGEQFLLNVLKKEYARGTQDMTRGKFFNMVEVNEEINIPKIIIKKIEKAHNQYLFKKIDGMKKRRYCDVFKGIKHMRVKAKAYNQALEDIKELIKEI